MMFDHLPIRRIRKARLRLKTGLALLLLWLAPLPVQAQLTDCSNMMTQRDLNECAAKNFALADAHLNHNYKIAIAGLRQLDPTRQAEAYLVNAQRAWITLRDNHCEAESYVYHGGSIEPMIFLDCKSRMTWARNQELINMESNRMR